MGGHTNGEPSREALGGEQQQRICHGVAGRAQPGESHERRFYTPSLVRQTHQRKS